VHVLDDASEHPWAPGIARAAAVLRAAGFGVETCALVGDPAARIAEQATMWGADLVAMSTHGRRGVARLAHRSVTQDVVRRVACPILVLRQRRETSRREASRRETSRREPLHACPGTDEAASYVR